MIEQRQNHYGSVFTEIEINVANKVIRDQVNRGLWDREEEQDLQQEVFLHLWKQRHNYIDSTQYANYVRLVTKRKLENLRQHRDAQIRKPEGCILPLDHEYQVEHYEETEKLKLSNTLVDESAIPPGDSRLDMYDDMWNVVKNEKPIFQSIFKLWYEGHSVKSMAEELSMKRTTLSDWVQKFKKMIRQAGLEDYLK